MPVEPNQHGSQWWLMYVAFNHELVILASRAALVRSCTVANPARAAGSALLLAFEVGLPLPPKRGSWRGAMVPRKLCGFLIDPYRSKGC